MEDAISKAIEALEVAKLFISKSAYRDSYDQCRNAIEALKAEQKRGEVVAWMVVTNEGDKSFFKDREQALWVSSHTKGAITPLYTHLEQARQDGMVLVRIDDLRKALSVATPPRHPELYAEYRDHPEALKRLAQAAQDAITAAKEPSCETK